MTNQLPILRSIRLGRILATALVSLLPLLTVGAAHGQGGRELIGGPITTARFERLLKLFVAPTPEEMKSLDRLHERYLERFRREIEPEIAALSAERGSGFPSKDSFQRLLRDLDRLNSRISETDNALFSSAMEAVAEPRRAGIARFKAARERQRLLAGVAQWVPMSFGNGAGFVDIADMLTRDRFANKVPPEAREQFNAFLASQETRLFTQARTLNTTARESMTRLYDLSASAAAFESPTIPANATPEEQARIRTEHAQRAGARMRAMAAAMEEVGRPVRKVLRQNHIDNRIACGQLAPILGKLLADEFRELVATRALGGEAYSFGMSMGDNLELVNVARRMRREAQATDEVRARIDEALARWRSERASTLESFVTAVDDHHANPANSRFANTGDPEDSAAAQAAAALEAARDEARARLDDADGKFQEVLLAILGDRVETYFEKFEPEEGDDSPVEFVVRTDEMGDGEPGEDDALVLTGGVQFGYVEPLTKEDVLLAFRLAGTTFPAELGEATLDSWLDEWMSKVGPLDEAYRTAQDSSYEYLESGGIAYKPQEFAKMADTARALVAAVCDADAALPANLGGALGLAADAPALTLLRLMPVRRLSEGVDVDGDELEAHTPTIAGILALADATPAEVEAILSQSKDQWQSLIATIRPALERIAALDEREGQLQMKSANNRDVAAVKEYSAQYEALAKERSTVQREFRSQLALVYDAACRKAVTDPDRIDALLRARTRATYPGVYSPEESAESVLTKALALRELDEGVRANVDALRAEYIAVFDKLCEEIVVLQQKATAAGADDWAEYTRQMDAVENLRFQRSERTAKALSELRRLLGAELAARIPGLAEKDDSDDESVSPFEDED
ncbi:MAG: hypothetical protein RLZZ116_601 [Planctomycetota bacterium]